MKTRLLIVLVALLIVTPLSAAITFGNSTVAAGSSWTETSRYGSSVDLVVDNGMGVDNPHNATLPATQSHQEISIQRTKKITVTSMQGQRIGGFQVEYTSVLVNGTDISSTFAGNKYVIDINGNHVGGVTYADGSTPPASELAFVQTDNSNIGQVREMANTFGGETVAVGGSLSAKNLDDLFDVQSGFNVDSYSMKLSSVSGDADSQVATFDVTLQISGEVKKGKGSDPNASAPFSTSSLHLSLSGPLHADVGTGRVLDFSLSGDATAGGQKEAKGKDKHGNDVVGKKGPNGAPRSQSISATGTATLGATFSY